MARRASFFKTTAFRLTAIYMVVFVLFSVVTVAYISYNASNRLRAQLDRNIQEEITQLSTWLERRGIRGLARYVDIRSRQAGSTVILLVSPQGQPLAGNIPSIPPGFLDHETDRLHPRPYRRRNFEGELERHMSFVRIIPLPNQFYLVVGRDIGERTEFMRVIFGFIVIALVALAILGFLTWVLVGRRVLRRIDTLSATSQTIVEGNLSGRLAIDGSGDEFDRLAENVNGMLDRIEALMIGLKDVSDNIAHDLKTPLTRMRNRVETSLSSKKSSDELRSALEETISESDHLIRVFDALLKIARVEAGSNIGKDAKVDLNALVTDVVELYDPVAEDAGVTLVQHGEKRVIALSVNRELVSQAVANLIDNAIKYSKIVDAPKVFVAVDEQDGFVAIKIKDNGPGIPVASRDQITKRFTRLETSRTEPGSGLGLSLVAAVAKLHGGELNFGDNAPGLIAVLKIPLKDEGASHE